MKVWEKINELKEAEVPMETIKDWAYMNRICPVEFEYELELPETVEYPEQLKKLEETVCDLDCGADCLTAFLESEYEEVKTNE